MADRLTLVNGADLLLLVDGTDHLLIIGQPWRTFDSRSTVAQNSDGDDGSSR